MAPALDGRAIEKALATLNERGINVVETEEAEADEKEEQTREKRESEETESSELVEVTPKTPAKSEAKEPIERTDDPVHMYLREMRSIDLLSRQGEVAIAKRIEAGREAMIAGLCESPLTFQAVTIWRNELNDGNVFLHDIIDLEATYAGPDAKAVPAAVPELQNGALVILGHFRPAGVFPRAARRAEPGRTGYPPALAPGRDSAPAREADALGRRCFDSDLGHYCQIAYPAL
jgi:hypothetical protein